MEIINEQVLIGEQMTHVVVAEVKYFHTRCPRCERFESVQRPELVVAQLYGLQLWYVVSDDLYDLNKETPKLLPLRCFMPHLFSNDNEHI